MRTYAKLLTNMIVTVCLLAVVLAGCSSNARIGRYRYEFFGSFDTVFQIIGYTEDREDFETMVEIAERLFFEYGRLYDIYQEYEGMNNLKTVNNQAGVAPVPVDQKIIDLLVFSIKWHEKTDGMINIAIGPLVSVWHEYRMDGWADPENARLPSVAELERAAQLIDIHKVVIDQQASTVYLAEKGMSLDVGAVAKGYACERVVEHLKKLGYDNFIISAGGNIRTTGVPLDGTRSKWGVGLQDPEGNPFITDGSPIDTVYVTEASLDTSGDYQRYYVVDGVRYHHIICPFELFPKYYFRAVTAMTHDSGVSDVLSTYLFLIPYEQGRALIDAMEDAEAFWIHKDGSIDVTDGMLVMLKELGGASNR